MNAGKPTLLKARPKIDPCITMAGINNVPEKLRGEESQGKLRWLRPEYQAPEETPEQSKLATGDTDAADAPTKTPKNQITKKQTWQTQAGKIRHSGPGGLDRIRHGKAPRIRQLPVEVDLNEQPRNLEAKSSSRSKVRRLAYTYWVSAS